MKIPVLKKDKISYIELPGELGNLESLELFQLKEGYYLLTTNLNSQTKTSSSKNHSNPTPKTTTQDVEKPITLEEELSTVSKLMSIPFAQRNPEIISKILNTRENNVFNSLIKKKHIWLFKGEKYKDKGVYNISNKLFTLWKEQKNKKPSTSNLFSNLQKDGFTILSSKNDAQQFSNELKKQMSLGKVLGIRGFDGKYYVATKGYYVRLRKEIMDKIKDPASLNSISETCNAPLDACSVVLKLMSENGEVIENRKDIFSII